jgi:hypothetical protein
MMTLFKEGTYFSKPSERSHRAGGAYSSIRLQARNKIQCALYIYTRLNTNEANGTSESVKT